MHLYRQNLVFICITLVFAEEILLQSQNMFTSDLYVLFGYCITIFVFASLADLFDNYFSDLFDLLELLLLNSSNVNPEFLPSKGEKEF